MASRDLRFEAYGLCLESDFDLLLPGCETPPDVHINAVPVSRDRPQTERDVTLIVPEVGWFRAHDGTTLDFEPMASADPAAVRRAIIGAGMGALLRQRGFLVMHGSVIAIGDGAVVVCGPSGRGKSTLTNAFLEAGFQVMSDDLAIISITEAGTPVVQPSIPTIRLLADSAAKADFDGADDRRHGESKIARPVPRSIEARPVTHVVFLENGGDMDIARLSDGDGFARMVANTRASDVLEADSASRTRHLGQCASVLRVATCLVFRRPRTYESLEAAVRYLADHVAASS